MSVIRKFDVSVVVEVTDPATDEEREFDDEPIAPLVSAAAVYEAIRCLEDWKAGKREYISVHVMEVP